MAPQLHELFEKVKAIRKRLKLKGHLVEFPAREPGEEDEEQDNPISTKSMGMNVPALKVMFEYYRFTSGKKVPVQKFEAQVKHLYENCDVEPSKKMGSRQFYLDAWASAVRELFALIKTIRDEKGQHEHEDTNDEEGEEEEGVEEDQCVSDYETEEADTGPSSAESKSKKSKNAKGAEAATADNGSGVGEIPLDSQEDAQVPKLRHRSKGSLLSLASTAQLGKTPGNVETPASYTAPVAAEDEAELARLLAMIDMEEAGLGSDADPHRSMLVMMVAAAATPDCKKKLDFEPPAANNPDQAQLADTLVEDRGVANGPDHGVANGPDHGGANGPDHRGANGPAEAIEVDSSPEKIKQEPSSPTGPSSVAEPVSLDAQNELRQNLRASIRRKRKSRSKRDLAKAAKSRRGKRKGKDTSGDDNDGEGEVPAAAKTKGKRKRGTCDADPVPALSTAKPKAKATAKAKAKTKATAKAKAKSALPKAKAKAKGKAKATAKKKVVKVTEHPLRLEPDRNRTGYSACGTLVLGCSSCRWLVMGCGTCLRTNFHGKRWNKVACPEE
ncbi:unnamed protein product [Symbiodinium sp. CCMP2592]|nr:unnamed protein product [Symbiodinium sp. CCMP2592]